MLRVKMEKKGVFTVEEVEDDGAQCGLPGMREYHYHVWIECNTGNLDQHGFIVDARELDRFMVERFRVVDVLPSCEMMCSIAAQEVAVKLCESRVQRVTVQVGNAMGGWMTAEWEKT